MVEPSNRPSPAQIADLIVQTFIGDLLLTFAFRHGFPTGITVIVPEFPDLPSLTNVWPEWNGTSAPLRCGERTWSL